MSTTQAKKIRGTFAGHSSTTSPTLGGGNRHPSKETYALCLMPMLSIQAKGLGIDDNCLGKFAEKLLIFPTG
jgi:hypothetical protein